MKKDSLSPILFSFIITSTLCAPGITPTLMQQVMANSATIYVPDRYDTIQEAVNAANPGDTIIVRPGIYSENVFLNKTLTLIGEDRNATIINGRGLGNVIHVVSSDTAIMNFTVHNSGNNPDDSGILLFGSVHTTIRNNIIRNNNIGVHLRHGSNDTLLIDNLVLNNKASGIRLADNNNLNHIIGNTLMNNTVGVEVQSSHNTFYHNNFISNKVYQVRILGEVSNRWDDGVEGNYWSDYEGLDTDGDGVGDTELPSCWVDDYPLIEQWSITKVFSAKLGEKTYYVNVQTHCTVTLFDLNYSLRQISFRITGPSGVTFFCNVSVPKTLLNTTSSESWLVQLNNTDITAGSTITENACISAVYFTCSFSTYEVRIRIVKARVVDFTPYAVGCGVAIAVIVITVFVTIKKKRRH
jgi:parallel beta-helix repeat protein